MKTHASRSPTTNAPHPTPPHTGMKFGTHHPMGPLLLADYIGLDTVLAILRVMQAGTGDQKFAPCPLLVQMVDAGWLGKKAFRGVFHYAEPLN